MTLSNLSSNYSHRKILHHRIYRIARIIYLSLKQHRYGLKALPLLFRKFFCNLACQNQPDACSISYIACIYLNTKKMDTREGPSGGADLTGFRKMACF